MRTQRCSDETVRVRVSRYRRRTATCARPSVGPSAGVGVRLWIGLLLGILACAEEPTQPSFPFANLVLISIDTLRADHLGVYGYPRRTSPTLDRLAREGIVFEQAISQATWTLPSHAALFTSRYPSELGLGRWPSPGRVPEEAETLAEVLRREGLATWGFTEWAWLSKRYGLHQGFASYDDRGGLFRNIVPRAVGRLPELRDSRFFLFLHTYDAHWYQPEAPSRKALVRPYDGPLRESARLREALQTRRPEWVGKLTAADMRYVVDLYDASIRDVDRHIERLVSRLEALGMWDDTLLVVTSDHGEEFLDHGSTGHGYAPWDEQVLVPLIIRLPGGRLGGQRVAEQVRTIDVMPTLLSLLDVPTDAKMRGTSLVPLMTGSRERSGGEFRPAFTDRGHRGRVSLRTPEWKLVYDTRTEAWSAYDLRADPGERHDRFAEDPAEVRPLRAALEKWLSEFTPATSEARAPPDAEELERLRALGYVEDAS